MSAPAVPGRFRHARKAAYAGTALALACAGALAAVTTSAQAVPGNWVGSSDSPIALPTGDNVANPAAIVDGDGRGTAVWSDPSAPGLAIRYATRPASQQSTQNLWSPGATAVSLDSGAELVQAAQSVKPAIQVAVDSTDRVTAVWAQIKGAESDIYSSDLVPGHAWTTPERVSAEGSDDFDPQIAVNGDDTTTIAWVTQENGKGRVKSRQRGVNETWQTNAIKSASLTPDDATDPQLAAGRHKFLLAWTRHGANNEVQTTQATNLDDWTQLKTQPLQRTDPDASVASVAVDEADTMSVVVRETVGTVSNLFASVRPATGEWSEPTLLSSAGAHATEARLAPGPNGQLLAVFTNQISDTMRAAVRWYKGGSWGQPVVLNTKTTPADGSAVGPLGATVDRDGRPTVLVGTDRASSKSFRSSVVGQPGAQTEVWPTLDDPATAMLTPDTVQSAFPVSISRDATGDVFAFSQATSGGLLERVFDNTAPVPTLGALPTVSPSLSVRPSWSATDVWSPITGHDLVVRSATWNGLFADQPTRSFSGATSTTTYPLGTGRTYCFSVASTDAADNTSEPTAERCTTTPVDERSTTASKGWTNKSAAGYYRNTYRTSYKKGATLTLTNVNAKTLQLITAVGPKNGKVTATFRGVRLGTWNLASRRNAHKTITVMNKPTAATGNLVLTVATSDTRVRHGKRVVVTHHPVRVDGITVLR